MLSLYGFGLFPRALLQAQEPPAAASQLDDHYRAGLAAVARNDFQDALKDFQLVVQSAPSAEAGHSALGFVLVRLGRAQEAIPELEKALAIEPSDSSAQMNIAIAYGEGGAPAKAVPYFSKLDAAAHAQGHPLAPLLLAEYAKALAATEQWNAADDKIREAIAADPQNADLHDQYGTLFMQRQNFPAAQQQFAEAARLKPAFAAAHLHLGLAEQAMGRPSSVNELERAYRLAPRDAAIAVEYGKALGLAGHDDQAIPVLRRALELSPKSMPATYQLALAYQRSDRVPDAIALLKKVVAANPRDSSALSNLGLALCQARQAQDAVPFLKKAVSLSPGNVTARQNLVAAYLALGQYDDAIAESRAALRLAPNDAQLHYNLGVAQKMQDDAAHAIPELREAEKLNPAGPEAPYVLGMLYLQAGDNENAAQQLETSLKLRPNNGEAWATLGSVYNSLGKLPEAAAALREAIQRLPDQADPHLTLAAVLEKQDASSEAKAERARAANLMRTHMNLQRAQVATNAAQALLKSGSVPEAIAQFKDALTYDPTYVDAHVGLAAALERQGLLADAATERQKADDLKKALGRSE
jgi:tetratricopeptide (TPR) repeat protein